MDLRVVITKTRVIFEAEGVNVFDEPIESMTIGQLGQLIKIGKTRGDKFVSIDFVDDDYQECLDFLDQTLSDEYSKIKHSLELAEGIFHLDKDTILNEMILPSLEAKCNE